MSIKIRFLFPKNYKHGLLGNDFYSETIEVMENIDLYKRFDFDGCVNRTFKRTSMWNKLNHFSFKPYLRWRRVFKEDRVLINNDQGLIDEEFDLFVYQATSLIKIIYKNYELNYLHNPTFKEIIFDFYLVHGIKIKIKKNGGSTGGFTGSTGGFTNPDCPIISFDSTDAFDALSGDYCIDISDYEQMSENHGLHQDNDSIENPFHI